MALGRVAFRYLREWLLWAGFMAIMSSGFFLSEPAWDLVHKDEMV